MAALCVQRAKDLIGKLLVYIDNSDSNPSLELHHTPW